MYSNPRSKSPCYKSLIIEAAKKVKTNGYILFSMRNLFSWYGINYIYRITKEQVPNFGPHKPLNAIKVLYFLKKNLKIVDTYGITPLPNLKAKK